MKQFDFWDGLDKPKWMKHSPPSYVTAMGSRAYGTATEDSDWDFYGIVVPPEEVVFPFLAGDIPDFGIQKKVFRQFQKQRIPSEAWGKEDVGVDVQIYSVQFFIHNASFKASPNMIDAAFTPDKSVLVCDNVGRMIRERRHLLLSQKLWHSFRGMAYQHLNRIRSRTREGKRKAYVEKYGYDVKDASHVIRVMLEVKDFLFTGDADLTANAETVSSVRNGLWTLDQVKLFFEATEKTLGERLENGESVLPKYPDQIALEQLLVDCLEERYGSLTALGWNTYGKDGQRC